MQPAVGSQLSSVHGLPSSHESPAPATQVRFWHFSVPLQASAAMQAAAAPQAWVLHVQLMLIRGAAMSCRVWLPTFSLDWWGGGVGKSRIVLRPVERSLAVRVLAAARHARRVGIVDVVVQIAAEVSAGPPAVAIEGAAAVARGGDAEGAEARERYGRQDDGV